jgi:hypothetical protein
VISVTGPAFSKVDVSLGSAGDERAVIVPPRRHRSWHIFVTVIMPLACSGLLGCTCHSDAGQVC